jgi:sulfite reductase alpha subunit-like flavoprotein
VALDIGRECTKRHIVSRVMSMDAYKIYDLPNEKIVLFVVSTTGNGEPPSNMFDSWKFLLRKDLPKDSLKNVYFSVFGLGDSSYELFNAMARKLY